MKPLETKSLVLLHHHLKALRLPTIGAEAEKVEPSRVRRRLCCQGSPGGEMRSVMPRSRKYPVELLDRATRLVFESGRPIAHVAADLGLPSETLRKYVRQVEANEGRRPDLPTSEEREEIRELRREVFELRRTNEILKAASLFFAGELDPHRPR